MSNKKSFEEMLEEIDKKREEEFIKDLREKFGHNNKSTTNWYDKNKFNKTLTTIDSNKFNHKNKTGKFKFSSINNLINDIKSNTISEANAKNKINELNKIKIVETKVKRLINSQKTLLSLFDNLKTIFNDNNNSNNSNNNESDSENENESVNKDENENESKNESENDNENENESDLEQYYEMKQINNNFEKIDETKSFEDQIDILKEIPWLNDYWYIEYYEDNKETNLRVFKLKFAHIFNDVDDNLFKEIFGLTSVKLADKLINITRKK